MALTRKDVRVYLDPEIHRGLTALADVHGVEPAHWIEALVTREVQDQVRAASLLLDRVDVAGIARLSPVVTGSKRRPGDRA